MGHGQLLQKLEHEISKFRLVECVQCASSLSLQSAEERRETERERESEREISTTWTVSQTASEKRICERNGGQRSQNKSTKLCLDNYKQQEDTTLVLKHRTWMAW